MAGTKLRPFNVIVRRATKMRWYVLYIYLHVYISDFHSLYLIKSRSLRTLANKLLYSELQHSTYGWHILWHFKLVDSEKFADL